MRIRSSIGQLFLFLLLNLPNVELAIGLVMDRHNSTSEVTIEALEAEIADLIDDPVLREEWLDSNIPILESRTPKSYYYTANDRARLMQVVLEMRYGEMA